jgi:3-dehydrotetronate 4-kinase
MLALGCIADDVTGATDIGSVLASVGRDVLVVFDTSRVDDAQIGDADAVVVALKTRTAPVEEAVTRSLAAARWLRAHGARRVVFKYCSTFDSTPAGNIGPVVDALLDELALPVAAVAPSYPRNGRTVYQGRLFVHHEPLDESPMRHHPLTPMTDASLERLLAPQTRHAIAHLYLDDLRGGRIAEALEPEAEPRIVIADAIDDTDLVALVDAAGEHVLLTGGAGIGLGLAPAAGSAQASYAVSGTRGERLVLSGSASAATREQVARAREHLASIKLDPVRVATDPDGHADEIFAFVRQRWNDAPGEPVLVYATDSLDDLEARDDVRASGDAVEAVLGRVARRAVANGLGALIVAGGETSGRVVQDLDVASLRIGPAIAPGVVWADAATSGGAIALALKSGNFGAADMFLSAWERLS